MQVQGTLCFLVCLFLLRDAVAMESGAETALRGGLAAGILGAAVATAFVQWMRAVTGADERQCLLWMLPRKVRMLL